MTKHHNICHNALAHNADSTVTHLPELHCGNDVTYLIRIRENPCAVRLGHPEPAAKYLAREGESSSMRSPDPSLRCAAFRMTHRARIDHNPYYCLGCHAEAGYDGGFANKNLEKRIKNGHNRSIMWHTGR